MVVRGKLAHIKEESIEYYANKNGSILYPKLSWGEIHILIGHILHLGDIFQLCLRQSLFYEWRLHSEASIHSPRLQSLIILLTAAGQIVSDDF